LTERLATLAGEDFLTAAFRTVTLAGAFLFAAFAASARISAHRFLVAATIAALPALLSLRLGFGASAVFGSSAAFFDAAHLFRCAAAIARLPAALILRLGFAAALGADAAPNWRSISAIF
jgi:hypothetical protein